MKNYAFAKFGTFRLYFTRALRRNWSFAVRPGRHHKTDVFTHNLLSLNFVLLKILWLGLQRFYTMLENRKSRQRQRGYVIFHNHEVAGARIAERICDRLKLSKKEKEKSYDANQMAYVFG